MCLFSENPFAENVFNLYCSFYPNLTLKATKSEKNGKYFEHIYVFKCLKKKMNLIFQVQSNCLENKSAPIL